jgi:hypothetical protein
MKMTAMQNAQMWLATFFQGGISRVLLRAAVLLPASI